MKSKQAHPRVAWGALVAFLLFALSARAKSPQPGAEEWTPISKEEWALNDARTNPGASALIAYREVAIDDVKSVETHSIGSRYSPTKARSSAHRVGWSDISRTSEVRQQL